MVDRPAGTDLRTQLDTLFQVGVVGELSDGQLLHRFLAARDEAHQAALTALVERHGPMVLRVCRQVLGDPHDVQDAFQATFLVLVRKARSVRKADSVASWLHGVARRVALQAGADAARRRMYERRSVAIRAAEPEREGCRVESWPELHEEIARLPERYREPVVLCYLEGLTTETAAMRIGCPRGTILSRLSRARERLRGRLTRRGLAPPAVLVGAGLEPEASAALPAALLSATVRTSLQFAGRRLSEASLSSAASVVLARGTLLAMSISKLKTFAAASLACVLALAGMTTIADQLGALPGTRKLTDAGPDAGGRQAAMIRSVEKIQAELAEATRRNAQLQTEVRALRAELETLFAARPTGGGANEVARGKRKTQTRPGQGRAGASDAGAGVNAMQSVWSQGSLIVVASPQGDTVTAYDTETGKHRSLRLGPVEVPLKVNVVAGPDIMALRLEGKRITRIAVFSTRTSTWHPQELLEPVEGQAMPIVSGDALYFLGRHIYTFSNKTRTWRHIDTSKIGDPAEGDEEAGNPEPRQ